MSPLISEPRAPTKQRRLLVFLLVFGLAGMLLRLLCAGVDLDPDLFHEMCLARAIVQTGQVPLHDAFAYTPTVYPVIHHEWGSGMIFYWLMTRVGPAGLMALRLGLIAALLATLIIVTRRRGAGWLCILLTVPATLILFSIGFTTVRAQLFTMVFTAGLLLVLNLSDMRGPRWLLIWPPLHLIWLNLHGGFVVGLGILFLHGSERSLRGKRIAWAYLGTLAVCLALIPVNPYGWAYLPFLGKSLTMPRPQINEWQPLWVSPFFLGSYLITIVLLLYCIVKLRPRRMADLVILLFAVAMALWHIRHISLYATIWLAMVPTYVQQTPLAETLRQIWQRWSGRIVALYALAGLICLIIALPQRPWLARLPATLADRRNGSHILYPTGAVDFFRQNHIQANVLAPFELGGYLSWELSPDIKVAVDGRYEVAYSPNLVEEFFRFYAARPGWQDTLRRYPPDLVLIPRGWPLSRPFAQIPGWTIAYQDQVFTLYRRKAS